MALYVDQVATVLVRCRAEEIVEADVVKGGGRGEACDMSAEFGTLLLARTTIAMAFQRISERMRFSISAGPGMRSSMCVGMVFRYAVLLVNGRFAPERRHVDHAVEQIMRPFRPLRFDDRFQRLQPLLGFFRFNIVKIVHVNLARQAHIAVLAAKQVQINEVSWCLGCIALASGKASCA